MMLLRKNFSMTKIPLIWAHRGSSATAPENTLLSFQHAIDAGADGIELDVQLTKDDVMVICHDELIDRTSNGKGYLKDYTFDELRQFDFNQNFKEFGPQQIPTLQEVFDLIKPTNLTIDIELKTSVFYYDKLEEKVLKCVKENGLEDRVNYSSFNHFTCVHLLELKPDADVGFLYWDNPIGFPEYAYKHGATAINPVCYNLNLPDTMEGVKKYHLKTYVWWVDTEEDILECANKEVTAIITDNPGFAKEVYQKYFGN